MNLTAKTISRKLKNYKEIRDLKNRAFPANEQIPMWLLLLLSKKKSNKFRAFFDDGVFCGFLYTMETSKMVFVLYLAVNDAVRSRGYGSRILSWLKNETPEKEIVLNVEPADENSENLSQRIRRIEFYKRNGFYETGAVIKDKKDTYAILSSLPNFSLKEYERLTKKSPLQLGM